MLHLFFMVRNKEEDFQYISEDDYKTLITIYQQKVFELFNKTISLEAKVLTLNSLVESLNETIEDITKEKEKMSRSSSKKRSNYVKKSDVITDMEAEGEMFN